MEKESSSREYNANKELAGVIEKKGRYHVLRVADRSKNIIVVVA